MEHYIYLRDSLSLLSYTKKTFLLCTILERSPSLRKLYQIDRLLWLLTISQNRTPTQYLTQAASINMISSLRWSIIAKEHEMRRCRRSRGNFSSSTPTTPETHSVSTPTSMVQSNNVQEAELLSTKLECLCSQHPNHIFPS